MRLWLVRHGETQANVDGLYSGHTPTPLTARGEQQAQRLGQLLHAVPFNQLLCSELARTQHTADLLLNGRTLPRATTPLLNEMFFGDWEMRHHRDLQQEDAERYAAWCADWQHVAPGGGEDFQTFSRRVQGMVAELKNYRHLDHLLIVGHQGTLSLLIALLLEMPAASLWHFRIAQGAWSAIDLYEDFATLRVLNSRAEWAAHDG